MRSITLMAVADWWVLLPDHMRAENSERNIQQAHDDVWIALHPARTCDECAGCACAPDNVQGIEAVFQLGDEF